MITGESPSTPVLEARRLSAGYAEGPVVRELDLAVDRGEIVGILGPNGAGKTTSLLALAGELPALAGGVYVNGARSTHSLHQRARNGLAFVTEERSVFPLLTVRDNLRVGRCDPKHALEIFPELSPRIDVLAGSLSGGEQQMLSLARALSREPKVLLADELSLGLAPIVVTRLLAAVRTAASNGVAVILVEQHVSHVLDIADRVYVLQRGRVRLSGRVDELRAQLSGIESAYFSSGAA